LVLPELWLPHAGGGVADKLVANGYTVEIDRWVTLRHGRIRPRVATPGDGWWCLAVASRYEMRDRRDLQLPATRSDPAAPRAAIHVKVDIGGAGVDVIGIHTSSRLWYGAPLFHIRGLRAQLPAPSGPAVLAGDFNLWGPGVDRLLPGWRRTVRGRTYPAHRPHSQIDHVLVNDHVSVVDAEVVDDRHSDHRPVRVRLRA
jgi:endonuclease/exonuclease/phosphatase family metal-dependent hydrolase